MKPFILVTKKEDFIETKIKGHICEATPKLAAGWGENVDESAITQSVY